MNYNDLKKLSYGSKKDYMAEYEKRFHSSDAVHLDFFIGEHQAFFVPCNEVTELVYDILKGDKQVFIIGKRLPAIALSQYTYKCMIDEIVLTNKIEGVHSSRREISDVLDELHGQALKKNKAKRFQGIVTHYFKLMSKEQIPTDTCLDIRNLYNDLVLPEVQAENKAHVPDGILFRKDPVDVYNIAGKTIHNGVYPESKINETMEKARQFLHDDSINELYRTCIFHYLLEYIHPFYDGNGRLGRFLVSYSLSQQLEPLLAYRISETIEENKATYYEAFKVCNHNRNLGDVTPFLIMMLTMISRSIQELEKSLESREESLNHYSKTIDALPWSADRKMKELYYILIQAALFDENGATIPDLENHLQCSYGTLNKYIKRINEAGMLAEKKVGKNKYYSIQLDTLDKYIE